MVCEEHRAKVFPKHSGQFLFVHHNLKDMDSPKKLIMHHVCKFLSNGSHKSGGMELCPVENRNFWSSGRNFVPVHHYHAKLGLSTVRRKGYESVEMWYLRRMERISYTAHKTNKFILSKTQKTRMLTKIIESRQLKFFGHVIRKEELEETILTGHINGKRNKGRHRKTYVDEISEKVGKSRAECIRAAKREEWKLLWKTYVWDQTRHSEEEHLYRLTKLK